MSAAGVKSYTELAEQLEALVDEDPERAHVTADGILGAALARAALTQEPPTEAESNHILSAWNAVPKWYA
jgi:hypothetical protein